MTNETRAKLSYWKLGSRNPRSKLSVNEVLRIRELRASGVGAGTIALKFGVSKNTIISIGTGRIWRHI